jgi:hypothetical protein
MIKRFFLIVFMLIVLLFLAGCMNLLIETDVDYPTDLFKKTMKKIEAIHEKDPHRKGSVSKLNVLVYDGEDRQLVRFSVKKGLAEMALKNGDITDDDDVKKYSKKYANLSLENIKNLDRLGPGLLIEIEVVEENTHVLIWLD